LVPARPLISRLPTAQRELDEELNNDGMSTELTDLIEEFAEDGFSLSEQEGCESASRRWHR
jgi:hypothetical protein